MRRSLFGATGTIILAAVLAAAPAGIPGVRAGAAPSLALGERVYREHCAKCHGLEGKGNGTATATLVPVRPKPRDFTRGLFKFRSTPSGTLPSDGDMLLTVRRGVPGTAMPAWEEEDVSEEELRAVVQYIKRFSPRFGQEEAGQPVQVPAPPSPTRELVNRGETLYREIQCFKCHGMTGKGDGEAGPDLRDDWDGPIVPSDFTKGVWRGGGTPRDLYRTIMTGMDGSPMPSFADALPAEADRWALVYYILSLSGKSPQGGAPTHQKGMGLR